MTVEITFQPSGLTGLIAEGAYLSDAAHRMGVMMRLDCKGRDVCTTCLVYITTGAELLSPPSEPETRVLGTEALAQGQRLACQVVLQRSGEVVVHVNPKKEKAADEPVNPADMRKQFGGLTLDKKIKTLVQLEALTMVEAFDAMVDKPLALGVKLFDRFFKPSSSEQQDRKGKNDPHASQEK